MMAVGVGWWLPAAEPRRQRFSPRGPVDLVGFRARLVVFHGASLLGLVFLRKTEAAGRLCFASRRTAE